MQRRNFLKAVLFFSGGITVSGILHQGSIENSASGLDRKLEKSLASLFGNLGSVKAIGQAYLKQSSEPVTKAKLMAQVFGEVEHDQQSLAQMNRQQLRAWLNDRQSQDFAQGRIVTLQGWVLSQTEVQTCALLSLAKA